MIDWQCKAFTQLDVETLFEVLKMRQDVFIVEQNSVYGDIDEWDKSALHLCGYRVDGPASHSLSVYARIIAPGGKFKEAAIGRVIVSPGVRGEGLGVVLMEKGLAICAEEYPGSAVRISAQSHLEAFYQGLGFSTVSAPYDEDGIEHIDMLRVP